MGDAFESLYLGKFERSASSELCALACRYHLKTEAFDRSVCTGPVRNGSILPDTTRQRHLINMNARVEYCALLEEARRLGFTAEQFHEAVLSEGRRFVYPEEPCELKING